MQIDLKELSNQDIINIDESVDIPKEYLQNTAILDLKKVSFVGKLFSNSEEEMLLEGNLEASHKKELEKELGNIVVRLAKIK